MRKFYWLLNLRNAIAKKEKRTTVQVELQISEKQKKIENRQAA